MRGPPLTFCAAHPSGRQSRRPPVHCLPSQPPGPRSRVSPRDSGFQYKQRSQVAKEKKQHPLHPAHPVPFRSLPARPFPCPLAFSPRPLPTRRKLLEAEHDPESAGSSRQRGQQVVDTGHSCPLPSQLGHRVCGASSHPRTRAGNAGGLAVPRSTAGVWAHGPSGGLCHWCPLPRPCTAGSWYTAGAH